MRAVAVHVTAEDLVDYLGKPRFYFEVAERTEMPGVATGLVWTPSGGDITFIEATRMKGSKRLILTGKLGDVMKESAQAAVSYVRSKAADLEIDEEIFAQKRPAHTRPGGCGTQRRTIGGRDDRHGPGIAADRPDRCGPTWP